MYYTHFGLTQPPFRITPDTEFFYGGGNRGPILEALIYAIGQGEGIIKVTGEVGSGKTMLCSMMQARLPEHIESVYLANPSVSPEEILHAIAAELHLATPRDAGHLQVMQILNRHLLERHATGKQVVMFVEESQSMPIATLEEIRLLSNLETAHSKLLQIVLLGQPELEDNLRQPRIRQLRERITHSFRLSPLKPDEIRDYLDFRLRAAGYRGPDLFSPQVVNAIAKSSDGLTRRVNLIADKAMLAAFAENTHTIKRKHIKAAVRDSEFSHYEAPQPRLRLGLALLLCALGAAIGIALYTSFEVYQSDSSPPREPQVAATTPSPPPTAPAVATSTSPAPAVTTADDIKPTDQTGATTATATPAAPATTAQEASQPAAPNPAPAPQKQAATSAATTPAAPATIAQEASQPVAQNPAPAPQKPIATIEKSIAGANSLKLPANRDELESRLAATKDWLSQGDKNAVSIQLLGTDNPSQLKHHLNVIRKYVEINDIFVYRTIAKQKPSLTVLYGSFDNRRAALAALAKLPSPLKAYKPVLRTKQGIRAEIAQHQSS